MWRCRGLATACLGPRAGLLPLSRRGCLPQVDEAKIIEKMEKITTGKPPLSCQCQHAKGAPLRWHALQLKRLLTERCGMLPAACSLAA